MIAVVLFWIVRVYWRVMRDVVPGAVKLGATKLGGRSAERKLASCVNLPVDEVCRVWKQMC